MTKACWAGGTIQIYINPARLRSTGPAHLADYGAGPDRNPDRLRERHRSGQSRQAGHRDDHEQGGADATSTAPTRSIPNRSGDVVVVTRPPYQSDAGTPGQGSRCPTSSGSTATCPTTSTSTTTSTCTPSSCWPARASKHVTDVAGLRAVDVAPTLSFLMGIPGPQNARGRDPLSTSSRAPTKFTRSHDPRRQRLARPADAAAEAADI